MGFLRYWTLSNIPLFLLAAPSIFLLLGTALQTLRDQPSSRTAEKQPDSALTINRKEQVIHCLRRYAFIQGLLALLALTSFHVQIITRISSGYPLWYFILARSIVGQEKLVGGLKPEWVVQWMVMYAIIQGVLFASFLPPA